MQPRGINMTVSSWLSSHTEAKSQIQTQVVDLGRRWNTERSWDCEGWGRGRQLPAESQSHGEGEVSARDLPKLESVT